VPAGVLPADLTVVQVGDLVDRGPDSPGVVELVQRFLSGSGPRWVQLAGNHEELSLFSPPRFVWPETLDPAAADRLRWWWRTRQMTVAAAVHTPQRDYLISHAGLTEGFWRTMLGSPETADVAAERIDSLAHVFRRPVFRAGAMLGEQVDYTAGPVWAAAGWELIPSWLDAGHLPFSIVHGHSTAWDWYRKRVRGHPELRPFLEVDSERRHVRVPIGDQEIIGIDPGHGARPARGWAPLLLTDAVVTVPA
jgi:hypothetical protein